MCCRFLESKVMVQQFSRFILYAVNLINRSIYLLVYFFDLFTENKLSVT
jgi:hypothetical protein